MKQTNTFKPRLFGIKVDFYSYSHETDKLFSAFATLTLWEKIATLYIKNNYVGPKESGKVTRIHR